MAHNLTFQHYDANKAWASKLGVCLQEIYVHAMHLLSQELHTSFNSRVTSFERKLQFQMHRCGCAVLTFVCPSGSPHTHWSAALRLIGHCDQKYQAFILLVNTQLCRMVKWSNVGENRFFLPSDLLDTAIRNTKPLYCWLIRSCVVCLYDPTWWE